MEKYKNHFAVGSTVAMMLALAGCGGDSSYTDSSAAPAATPAAPASITGTAATGAAFAGATVTVTDKSGAAVGTGTTGTDGSFKIPLAASAVAPLVLNAVRDDQTLVSIAPDSASSTINITPITNLIAARLSPSGNPSKLAAELQANPALITRAKVTAGTSEIVAVLKPVLDALGSKANPLTDAFVADGTGADRVLDSLSIHVTPQAGGTSNIEVTVKQNQDDSAAPVSVQFSNAAATLAPLPAVDAGKLVQSGVAPLIAKLLAKMTACQALPVTERVNTPDTNAIGATDIKSATCKEIFYNNDPTTFKSNGRIVGSSGAFGIIFRSSGNNVVFDRGSYEFTRANGDLVIGYRATDAAGNVAYDTFAVRPDNFNAPTKLQQIGNQYAYDGSINAYHQLREFVNQPSNAYYSTGYSPQVNNTLSGGKPIFTKVVITTPDGGSLVLKPKTGFGTLQLVKDPGTSNEVVTSSSFVRIRSTYVSADKAALDPRDADKSLFFSTRTLTEGEVIKIQQKGVWRYDYYLAGNATSTPDATQYYRTRTRALAIGELKQQPLAALTTNSAGFLATSAQTGSVAAPAGGLQTEWTVGPNALAPTSIKDFGFITLNSVTNAFSESAIVGSTTRTGTIACTKSSLLDAHCTGSVVNAPSMYATGARINGLHLFARDSTGREYAHFYATYSIGEGTE